MRAVLLAAGFATRLYPLTRDRPKPLLEVAGRPVLSWVLDAVVAAGVRGVVVVTNGRFASHFASWAAEAGSGVPIAVVSDGVHDDADRLGAIADLRLALALTPADEDLLVVAGDNLFEGSLQPFVDAFLEHREPLLVCRRMETPVPPGRHGEVEVDGRGMVVRFREKPRDPRSELVATSTYLLPCEVRGWLDAYLGGDGDRDAPGHFVAWLVDRMPVRAGVWQRRTFDIGDRDSLEAAREEFRQDG